MDLSGAGNVQQQLAIQGVQSAVQNQNAVVEEVVGQIDAGSSGGGTPPPAESFRNDLGSA